MPKSDENLQRSTGESPQCFIERFHIPDSMSIDISHLFVCSGLGWSPVGVVLPSLMAHDRVAFREHEEEQFIFPSWRVSLCAYVFTLDNDIFYSLT